MAAESRKLIHVRCGWPEGWTRERAIRYVERVNARVGRDEKPCVTKFNVPAIPNPRWYAGGLEAKWLKPEGITCPSCGQGDNLDTDHRAFSARVTRSACEDACETATGGNCSCSCGGMQHGIRA